jgi:hypothetical protein
MHNLVVMASFRDPPAGTLQPAGQGGKLASGRAQGRMPERTYARALVRQEERPDRRATVPRRARG